MVQVKAILDLEKFPPEYHLQSSRPCSSPDLHCSRRFSSAARPAGHSTCQLQYRNRIGLAITAHYKTVHCTVTLILR